MTRRLRIVGPGRAGSALAAAASVATGWAVEGVLGRGDDVGEAAAGVDLLVLAVPDPVVASVASSVAPDPSGRCVVAHLAGSLGLDALAPHPRRAVLHPLVSMTDGDDGSGLRAAWWGLSVGGDPLAEELVRDLDGHVVRVADADRARYHAAAAMAANHVVALLGQVERVAASIGVPLEAYLGLAQSAVDNVRGVGPAAALTGPVQRGDWATVERHRAALPPGEVEGYDAMVREASKLR